MLKKYILSVLIAALGLLMVPAAQAHTLTVQETSGLAGLLHPLLGLDHMLAMLAIGLWAAQQGGHRVWQLPLVFLGMMMLGVYFGQAGGYMPLIESGIASSLLVMGLLLTFAIRLTIMPSMMLVGLFAVFHGYAHTAEMPQSLAMFAYVSGFMFATAALQGLGITIGLLFRTMLNDKLLRIGGIAIGFTGAWLWI